MGKIKSGDGNPAKKHIGDSSYETAYAVGTPFQALFDEAPLGIYLVDTDFRIRAVNPTALPVFGDIPDLIGRDFDETIHILWDNEHADNVVRIFRHTLDTGEPYFHPVWIERRLDRDVIEYYEWQVNRIPMPEGGYGVVCYFRDIAEAVLAHIKIAEAEKTYRIQLEKEVSEGTAEIKDLNRQLTMINQELAARNTELKTFNYIAANDYNETLRNLYTSLEYIVSHDARNLSDTGKANIRRAQSGIQKMKLLTEDILSYTRLHEIETKPRSVDLNMVMKNVLADFTNKMDLSHIQIECDSLPVITGYPFLISLVFHHLTDNAIKFSKPTGGLHIRVTCREFVTGEATGYTAAQPNSSYHIVSMTDNGIGFTMEESKKIFDIFYRINDKGAYKGSGIGLAICRKIMEIHGGFITTESEPANGSTFHCFFPIGISNTSKDRQTGIRTLT